MDSSSVNPRANQLDNNRKKGGIIKKSNRVGASIQNEVKAVTFQLDNEFKNRLSNEEKVPQFPRKRRQSSLDMNKYDYKTKNFVEPVKVEKHKLFSQSNNRSPQKIESPKMVIQLHALNPINSIVKVNESRSLFFSTVLAQYKSMTNDSNNCISNDIAKELEYDIKGQKAVHIKNLFKLFKLKENEKLKNSLQYYLRIVKIDELKEDFKMQIKDQSLIKMILPYIFDNLKRRFRLKNIAFSLFKSVYLDKDIKPLLSEKLLLIFLLEAVSDINTSVYLGPMLILNDFPVPFAYWTLNDKEKFQWKINFKLCYDVLGSNKLPLFINMGTSSTKNSGKTSFLKALYSFNKDYLPINKRENPLPSPSIDIYRSVKGKRDFVMFDVHGFSNDQIIYDSVKFKAVFKTLFEYASAIFIHVKPKDITNLETNEELKSIFNLFEKNDKKCNVILLVRDVDTEDDELDWSSYDSSIKEYRISEKQISRHNVKNLKSLEEFSLREEEENIKKEIIEDCLALPNVIDNMLFNISIFEIEDKYKERLYGKYNQNKVINEIQNGQKLFNSDKLENIDKVDNEPKVLNHNVPSNSDKSSNDASKLNNDIIIHRNQNTKGNLKISSYNNEKIMNELQEELNIMTNLIEDDDEYDPLPILSSLNRIYNLELEKNDSCSNVKFPMDDRKINYIEDEIDNIKDSITDNVLKSKLLKIFITITLTISNKEFIKKILILERYIDEWKTPLIKSFMKSRQDYLQALTLESDENVKQHFLTKINTVTDKIGACNITIDKLWDEAMLTYEYLTISKSINRERDDVFDILKRKYIEMIYNGFPIHLARGNDLKISNTFLDEVIHTIDLKQNMFVISVIGKQSSAKSTLLNYLFGCNFAVSAGRCTRGMYTSFVKTENNQNILIMDTEGLMSVERKDEIFDRQMALISFACSNLVIINHKGDIDRELKNLMQTVLYAMKHIKAIKIKPKILFVLRDQAERTSKKQDEALTRIRADFEQIGNEVGLDYKELIDIDFDNLILLPSAFNNEMNNEVFSEEILLLRKKVIDYIHNVKVGYLPKFREFFSNIKSLWETIVQYGKAILDFNTIGEILMKLEISKICDSLMRKNHKVMLCEVEKSIDEFMLKLSNEDKDNIKGKNYRNNSQQDDIGIPSHIFEIIELKKSEVLEEFKTLTGNNFTGKLKNYYYEKLEYQFMNFDLLVRQLCEMKMHRLKEKQIKKDLDIEILDNIETLLKEDKLNENGNKIEEELLIKLNIEEKFKKYLTVHLKYYQDIKPVELLERIMELYNLIVSTKFYADELYREANYLEKTKLVNYFNGNTIFNIDNWTLNYINDIENPVKLTASICKSLTNDINYHIKIHIMDKIYSNVTDEISYDIMIEVVNLLTEFFCSEFYENNQHMINRLNMINDLSYMVARQIALDTIKKRKQKRDEEVRKLEELKKQQIEEYMNLYKYRKDSKLTGENIAKKIFNDIQDEFLLQKTSDLKKDISKNLVSKFPNQKKLMELAYKNSFEAQNSQAIYKYCTNVNAWINEVFDMKYKEIAVPRFKKLAFNLKSELQEQFDVIFEKIERWRETIKKDKFNIIEFDSVANTKDLQALIGSNSEYEVNKFYSGFMKKFRDLTSKSMLSSIVYESIETNISNMLIELKKHYIGCQARCPLCKNKCTEMAKPGHIHTTKHLLKAFGGTGTIRDKSNLKIPALEYCISTESYQKGYFHPSQKFSEKPKFKNLLSFIKEVYCEWYPEFEKYHKKLLTVEDEQFDIINKIRLRKAWMKSKDQFLRLYKMKDIYPEKWRNQSLWEDSASMKFKI